MIMKKYTTTLAIIAAAILGTTSCIKDLNVEPMDDDVVLPSDILTGPEQYEQVLAKCYVGLATSGSWGENSADIDGINNGFGQYIRALFYLEEFPTEEALCTWDDNTVGDLHFIKWTASDIFIRAMFSRGYFQISMCNELIRQANASQFKDDPKVQEYIAEARALRLLSYYHMVDMFGYKHIPFATEENSVGSVGPAPSMELVPWMINEAEELLKSDKLAAIRSAEYGRVDKGFVQMLKAKINLNAPVYLELSGADAAPYYVAAAEACKAIVAAYPTLHPKYEELFMSDNHLRTDEIIFGVEEENGTIQTWGSTQFLVCATYEDGDSETASKLGTSAGGWGGLVTTPTFLGKFDRANDKRFMFWGGPNGFPETLDDPFSFKTGWSGLKFTNVASTGAIYASDAFISTDFPLFRSADAYLMLAECQLRGASNVTESEAKAAWNAVRTRAGLGNVSNYTLDELLDERGRELYWECHRRSDLIRFGKFAGSTYNWTWKGGEYDGAPVDAHFALFPIPAAETNSNSKLGQNPGYAGATE